MRTPIFYVLLAGLVVLDGWLLSHPNLIGRAGVFIFKYDYLATFPRAVATVAGVVGVALLLDGANRRFFKRPVALIIAVMLVVLGLLWLVQSVGQFSSGVYRLTGAGFKAGAVMLPALVTLIFANGAYALFRR